MNKIKLLSRLEFFFNADEKKKKKKVKDIEAVIKKLKIKKNKLKKMLDECQDDEMKKALQLEFDIIKAQIEKGMTVLNDI